MKDKKPDNVVYNSDTQQYDAAIKTYGTNLGAPVITTVDTMAWKNRSITKINHKLQARFQEIKSELDTMKEVFEYNQLIFDSKFSFEPIVGKIYHLYKNNAEENFLSIIAPHECNFTFLGSFYLNTEQIWEKHKNT